MGKDLSEMTLEELWELFPIVPPFPVIIQMMKQMAEIAEKVGRISNYRSFETKPYLRKNNRIRSVWSSVAIEANSLSLDEVTSRNQSYIRK